ncbi:putative metalloprotease arx1 [Phlyctochytrium planicorne]|nr:putative metalloprotease arx1 [Phlyctochytrium planicorne]
MEIDYQVELDKDNTLTDVVIQKYQTAAAFANGGLVLEVGSGPWLTILVSSDHHPKYPFSQSSIDAIRKVILQAVPGAKVSDLCKLGDDFILDQTSKVFTKGNVEKGIAFPTCISVNELVQCYSPLQDDTLVLKPNDVVKVELGVHIDGYIATLAHTTVLNPNPQQPVTGRTADAICAAYYAAEAALRVIRYGARSTDVIEAINEVAHMFNVKPVVGTHTFLLKRFLIESEQGIPNGIDPSVITDPFIFMDNEVYGINIIMSTGTGTSKSALHKPTVFQRDVQSNYSFKLKASRFAFNDLSRTFGVFPFSLRALVDMNPGHRLGIQECLSHEVVLGRPVLTDLHGEIVAQFKLTTLLLPSGPMRLTAQLNPPFVHSDYSVDGPIAQLLKTDVKVAKAKNPLATSSSAMIE